VNVTNGIWKASQNLTNLAALTEESISKHPASTFGWLATNPMTFPSTSANATMIFLAKFG